LAMEEGASGTEAKLAATWRSLCSEDDVKESSAFGHSPGNEVAWLYGELSFEAVAEAVRRGNPRERRLFVDVGCGRGCPLVAAGLLGFERCVGIEYLEERAEAGKALMAKALAATTALRGELVVERGDAFDPGSSYAGLFEEADFVLCATTAFGFDEMRRLARTLDRCKPTAILATTGPRRIPSVGWRVAERFVAPCSWGSTPVFVHTRDSRGALADFLRLAGPQLEAIGLLLNLADDDDDDGRPLDDDEEETTREEAAFRVVTENDFEAAAGALALVRVEDQDDAIRVQAQRDLTTKDCFLVDHAFTWSTDADADAALSSVPQLRERLSGIAGPFTDGESLRSKPNVGAYAVARDDGERPQVFFYAPDEVGAAALGGHQDERPNCALGCFFDLEDRVAFSLLWPTETVQAGELLVAERRSPSATDFATSSSSSPSGAVALNREVVDYALQPALERAMRGGEEDAEDAEEETIAKTIVDLVVDGLPPKASSSFAATEAWAPVFAEALGVAALPAAEIARRRRGKVDEVPWLAVASLRRRGEGVVVAAVSGGAPFDAVDDKADLARALARRGISEEVAPRTIVVAHDAETIDAAILEEDGEDWLLKLSNGYGGRGIHVCRSVGEALAIVREAAALARELPFHDEREKLPGWVLQRRVASALTADGKPFHLRTYVVSARGRLATYSRHEVRVGKTKDVIVTNGLAGADRRLLDDEAFLSLGEGLPKKLDAFVAHLCDALFSHDDDDEKDEKDKGHKDEASKSPHLNFAVAAVDTMLDVDGNLTLLEFNVNPSAPTRAECSPAFWSHLTSFASRLVDHVLFQDGGAVNDDETGVRGGGFFADIHHHRDDR